MPVERTEIAFDQQVFDLVELLDHEKIEGRFRIMFDSQRRPSFVYTAELQNGRFTLYPMNAVLAMRATLEPAATIQSVFGEGKR